MFINFLISMLFILPITEPVTTVIPLILEGEEIYILNPEPATHTVLLQFNDGENVVRTIAPYRTIRVTSTTNGFVEVVAPIKTIKAWSAVQGAVLTATTKHKVQTLGLYGPTGISLANVAYNTCRYTLWLYVEGKQVRYRNFSAAPRSITVRYVHEFFEDFITPGGALNIASQCDMAVGAVRWNGRNFESIPVVNFEFD